MNKVGLYIGRFQPFHLGHLSMARRILEQVDHLIIGVGSAQYFNEKSNPFTFEERKKMIELTLEELKIEEVASCHTIIPILDIHDNEKWPSHVQETIGEFNQIFVGDNGVVKELFEKHTNIPVKLLEELIEIRASKIRDQITKKGNWSKYLTLKTAQYLEKIGGIDRILKINTVK